MSPVEWNREKEVAKAFLDLGLCDNERQAIRRARKTPYRDQAVILARRFRKLHALNQ